MSTGHMAHMFQLQSFLGLGNDTRTFTKIKQHLRDIAVRHILSTFDAPEQERWKRVEDEAIALHPLFSTGEGLKQVHAYLKCYLQRRKEYHASLLRSSSGTNSHSAPGAQTARSTQMWVLHQTDNPSPTSASSGSLRVASDTSTDISLNSGGLHTNTVMTPASRGATSGDQEHDHFSAPTTIRSSCTPRRSFRISGRPSLGSEPVVASHSYSGVKQRRSHMSHKCKAASNHITPHNSHRRSNISQPSRAVSNFPHVQSTAVCVNPGPMEVTASSNADTGDISKCDEIEYFLQYSCRSTVDPELVDTMLRLGLNSEKRFRLLAKQPQKNVADMFMCWVVEHRWAALEMGIVMKGIDALRRA